MRVPFVSVFLVFILTVIGGLFYTYKTMDPVRFGAVCTKDTKKDVYEKYTSCGLTAKEKIDLVAAEVAKIGPLPRSLYKGYDIEVVQIVPFDKGVEVYIRAWTPEGQIGFGPDGSVDIEKVRIIDPSLLVPDSKGSIIHSYQNPKGQTEAQNYKLDPRQAMLDDIILAIRRKSVSDHIVPNTVGNTTTIQPASQDNYMDSENPTSNNSSDATLSTGDASTASSQTTVSTLTFDVAGNVTAGSTITSATLSLYEYQAGKGGVGNQTTLTVKRILRNWVNAQETYNVYSTGNSWTTGGAQSDGNDRSSTVSATLAIDSTAAGAFVDITGSQLTTDVQDMLDNAASNYGWGLYNDGSGAGVTAFAYNFFRSSNYATSGDRPKLVIESTTPSTTYDDDDDALAPFWP